MTVPFLRQRRTDHVAHLGGSAAGIVGGWLYRRDRLGGGGSSRSNGGGSGRRRDEGQWGWKGSGSGSGRGEAGGRWYEKDEGVDPDDADHRCAGEGLRGDEAGGGVGRGPGQGEEVGGVGDGGGEEDGREEAAEL